MIPPHIVRVLASVRIPSGHGPDVDYELVHAIVSSGAGHKDQHESVLLRIVVGNAPKNDRSAEILVQDLPAVLAQWERFVTDVLWRRAEAGDTAARAALERIEKSNAPAPIQYVAPPGGASSPIVISASGGRFGHQVAPPPAIPVKKEKKVGETAPEAPIIPSVSSSPADARKVFGQLMQESAPTATVPETPRPSDSPFATPRPSASPLGGETRSRQFVPDRYQVIGFNLSSPPTADGLMRPLQAATDHLIVVAPMTVAKKAEDFIKELKAGTVRGRPKDFEPIVVRRSLPDGPIPSKKLRAELAGGIARLLGDPNSALWILPE